MPLAASLAVIVLCIVGLVAMRDCDTLRPVLIEGGDGLRTCLCANDDGTLVAP